MNKVLVAGIDSVVGGNLAACLAHAHSVTGVALSTPVAVSGCEMETLNGVGVDAVRQMIDRVKPQRVVYCGRGSHSAWEDGESPDDSDLRLAETWIEALRQSGTQLTVISSAAIFTGPWMFHSENSQSVCDSAPAQCLHAIETAATAACPDSLIVRTHAFGWQPGGQQGWLESLLARLEQGQSGGLDCFRYGSPILASDLSEVIQRAWMAGLSGVYHIAGAERVNPVQFARRLAHHFQLPFPVPTVNEVLVDRPSGFGCGETSLQTRKIRRALHVSLPMLEDGIVRLFQQHVDGYRTRLTGHSAVPGSRVA